MKRNLEILRGINEQIMELNGNEVNEVLRIVRAYSHHPEEAATKISEYLSSELPVNVGADLILFIIQ